MVENFGKWVHCTSYLKTVRDGRCLETVKDKNGEITDVIYIGNGDDIPDECECCGSLEFLKTYYEKKETEFDGVLVGTKKIVVDGYLYGDTNYDFRGYDHIVVGKQANTTVLCGIVFFGNNQKRYVPMEDLAVIPDDLPNIDFLRTALSKYFDIGDSDCYHLTRVKEAFALGTMTLDDFVEFDEESVENILTYIQEEWKKND